MFNMFIEFVSELALWTYLYEIYVETGGHDVDFRGFVEFLGQDWVEETYVDTMALKGVWQLD